MIYTGSTQRTKIYLGSTQIQKAYIGSQLYYSAARSLSEILADGQTAAWYAFDDITLKIDANNKVIAWGDKLTYSEGAEMIDQNNWYKLSYYNAYGANWSQDGNSLHSNGAGGTINKTNFWQIGHNYKVTVSFNATSGEFRPANDNGTTNRYIPPVGASTVTYYVTPASTTMYQYSATYLGNITALSIKEVPANTLIQTSFVAGYQPILNANGVLFNGTSQYLKSAAFTLNQPECIYMVVKQNSWTNSHTLIDGYATYSNIQQFNVSRMIRMYGGATASLTTVSSPLGTYEIIRAFYNSTNSKFQINANTPSLGDAGIFNAGGLTLGARYMNDAFASMEVKEIIVRKAIDSTDDETVIYNYLINKYFYEGAELVNQSTWYTSAYWTSVFGANWAQSGTTLTNNGGSGSLGSGVIWALRKLFRVRITVVRNSGSLDCPYDGTTKALNISASGTYTYDYTPNDNGGRMYMGSIAFNGSITALSIKQIGS